MLESRILCCIVLVAHTRLIEGFGVFTRATEPQYQAVQPQVVDCDGSYSVTLLCDQFCKSIQAYQGYCDLARKNCLCVSNPNPIPESEYETKNASTPIPVPDDSVQSSVSAIHEIPAPDLSGSIPPVEVTPDTENSTVSVQGVSIGISSTTRKRRLTLTARQALEPVVKASLPNSDLCSPVSCRAKCDANKLPTCRAECVGLSCYCRCSNPDKPYDNSPEPLLALAPVQPHDYTESDVLRPPISRPVEDLNPGSNFNGGYPYIYPSQGQYYRQNPPRGNP